MQLSKFLAVWQFELVLNSSVLVLFSSKKNLLVCQFSVLKKWGENQTELNFGNTKVDLYHATPSNGIAYDSEHHTKLQLAFDMTPIHTQLEMVWRMILKVHNKSIRVQFNTSEPHNEATELRAMEVPEWHGEKHLTWFKGTFTNSSSFASWQEQFFFPLVRDVEVTTRGGGAWWPKTCEDEAIAFIGWMGWCHWGLPSALGMFKWTEAVRGPWMGDNVAWRSSTGCGGVLWTWLGGESVRLSDELWLLCYCAGGSELRCCVAGDELTFLPSCLTGDDLGGVGGCTLSSWNRDV